MIEVEGIVVKNTPFRDNDAMVTILSENRLVPFLARGVMKPTSKNASSVLVHTKGRYVLYNGKEGLFLKNAELIQTYPHAKQTLTCLTSLGFLSEINLKLLVDEDTSRVYPFYSKALELLEKEFDPLTVDIIYLAQVLKAIGYGLNVDECQLCHRRGPIAVVDYRAGGFICPNCFNGQELPPNNSTKLKIIRYIFKVDLERFGQAVLPKAESIEVLKELFDFVKDHTTVDLKSFSLIEKILKLD